MSDIFDNLIALYDRPLEPILRLKLNKRFIIPREYKTDRYKDLTDIEEPGPRSYLDPEPEYVEVKYVPPPNLDDILTLDREKDFSLFIPKHKKLAARLIDIFLDAKDLDELLAIAIYARERVNPYLFMYAYSVALVHREDTKSVKIPNQLQTFPDKYCSKHVLKSKKRFIRRSEDNKKIIEIPYFYTASDKELEHKVAYWREDPAVNLHHWHWHLVYPNQCNSGVVGKDRRGEMFYYSHQQILARYNFERFCNGLKSVQKFVDWDDPIDEAYFPKLDISVANRAYPPRPKGMVLQDIDNPTEDLKIDVADMTRWRERIYRAIELGYAETGDCEKINLYKDCGIDILGNMLESSDLSPNKQLYGDLHSSGHILIAMIHDPKDFYKEPTGVMGAFETAMRDPIFYRWHAFVDDTFQRLKEKLPPYTERELAYEGIEIKCVTVKSESNGSDNVFKTHLCQTEVPLSNGLDFNEKSELICIRFTHLQHEAFTYKITVRNNTCTKQKVTCRIFLAPATDEDGDQWTFAKQRLAFMEMDKFRADILPGEHDITRSSADNSVTIPFERTFRDLNAKPNEEEKKELFNFCGCGWPYHLLVPKGTAEGFPCHLFVMITNFREDRVKMNCKTACKYAESYCGIRGEKYPDKKPMGFPFDRLPRCGVHTLEDFLTPNMYVTNCKILHTDKIL